MKKDRFDEIVNEIMQQSMQTLSNKAMEYAAPGDRLNNFKVAGRFTNQTPEQALRGMKVKHDVSVNDMIENLDRGIVPSLDLLQEKIGDSINYLILLEALFIERIENGERLAQYT